MKKIIRKSLLWVFVLFMTIGAISPMRLNAAVGDGHNVTETFLSNWKAVTGNAGVYGNATLFTVDGIISWCLQANKGAVSGTNYEVNFTDIGITYQQERDLGLIANFGYFANPTEDNRVKTGNTMWNYLGWKDHYVKTDGSWTTSQQNAFNVDIMAKVNAYKQGPSFSGTSVTVNAGETITLTDTNGALDSMQVISNDGLNATINGNVLSITGTISANDNSTIVLKKPVSNESAVNFVVRNGSSQGVGICKTKDPLRANVYVKVNKFGSLELAKQDNKTNFVPGTSFKLSYNADMTSPIGTYTTVANGKIKVDELLPQKVYIQETDVPDHLLLDSTIYSKDIVSNVTTSYNATNNWKQGYVQVVKKDKDSGKVVKKAGTVFNVHKSDNSLVATVTTGANGVAKTGLLDYGDYYIQEVKAPNGYTVDATKYPVNVRTNLETVEQVVSNKEVRGSITLNKEDSETGGTAQGSASLLGAKYKLYAKSNIIDPADGSILISANSLIGEKEVDVNRKIVWDNLYLGDYYVQESKAPIGYNIDTTKYNVTLTYADQNTAVITKSITSKEAVVRGDIYLVKYLDNSIDNPALQKPGKNIVFKFTSKTTSQSFYIKTNEHGHASTQAYYYTDEACTNKVTSNARGALPFDNYIVQEVASTTPPGYNSAPAWDVTISNESEVLHYIVENTDITTPVKVVKVDKTTGRVIPVANTEFRLLDSNKNPITMTTYYPETIIHKTFKTSPNGYFQFPNHLAYGTYYLEEVNAPTGYLKGELLEFKVTSSNTGDWTNPLIVEYADNPAMGKANIQKLDDSTDDGIANTVIGIYAREDIITLDGTTRVLKDELVDTVTTIKDGKAVTKDLFLGKYYAKELKQAPGFALSDQEYDFELLYKDQETPIVEVDVDMLNSPTKLKLIKTHVDSNKALEGIKFKIVNKEIQTAINNAVDGVGDDWMFGLITEIIDEGFSQGSIYTTDKDGEINIKYLMPGTYTVEEVETLDGLVLDSTIHEFTVDENGLIDGDDLYILNITNAPTKIEFDKTNEDGSIHLSEAHFDFIDKETGKVVIEDYVTTEDSKIFEGVFVAGRTYIARETLAPEGYIASEDVEFTVKNTSDMQHVVVKNKKMLTHIEVVKTDSVTKEAIIDNEFEFTMYADKECTQTLEAVRANTEDGTVTFKDIEYGQTVYIKESKAPMGYQLSDEVKEITLNMKLEGIGDVHSFNFENSKLLTQIQVNKVDLQTMKPIISKDFEFTMYEDKECTQVLDVVNANTLDGTATFKDVAYGQTVYIKETKAPEGYLLSEEVKVITLDMDLEGIGEVHSFVYQNAMMPIIVETPTNDTTNVEGVIGVLLISLASCISLAGYKKYNGKKKRANN